MPALTTLLLPLLVIDGIIEMAFIGSTVSFLHRRAGKSFLISSIDDTPAFALHGKPVGLLVDQGHTSNGAAGTAVVLVGFGGVLALWRQRRRRRQQQHSQLGGASVRGVSKLYLFWTAMTVLSALLTLAALIYTFIVTHNTSGQHIDVAVAYANREPAAYPLLDWTPETWFDAVLELPLASASDRSEIRSRLRIIRGWKWNLIPLLVLGLAVAVAAVREAWRATRSSQLREKGGV